MNHKTLTPTENAELQRLCYRQIHLQEQGEKIAVLPWKDIHEETGLPVFLLLCLLADAAERTDTEITRMLSL